MKEACSTLKEEERPCACDYERSSRIEVFSVSQVWATHAMSGGSPEEGFQMAESSGRTVQRAMCASRMAARRWHSTESCRVSWRLAR
jgi:hypothetical protein